MTPYTLYIEACGYAAFEIETTVTQCTSAANSWMSDDPAVFGASTVSLPANGMMDADDDAAIMSFANGTYLGAPAHQHAT